MNTWRPFASDIVGHTFEDFRKKYDKVYTSKAPSKIVVKEKFDTKTLFPYKLSSEDLEKRLKDFEFLQKKVGKQRYSIKKRDEEFELKKKLVNELHQEEIKTQKNSKKEEMQRIRSLGKNRSFQNDSQQSIESNMFLLTSIEKTNEIYKKPKTTRLRFPNLTPKNSSKPVL